MSDIGKKRQLGQTGSRTIVQLKAVRYKITLSYLGHERIQHDEDDYRCIYELQRGEAAITTFPDVIKNQVRESDTTEEDDKAATPTEEGGDATNPSDDQVYRVMVTDNHGMRSADSSLLGRGGSPDGDSVSKPENYEDSGGGKRDWMPDVSPAVPFRIVVRKMIGVTPVDLDQPVKVKCEIKDPVEEFSQNDGRRRTFLEEFFKKYNKDSDDPDDGDDNAHDDFGGLRDPDNPEGVKATDVLKKVTYDSPPTTDVSTGETQAEVEFSDLSDATAEGDMGASFELTEVDDNGVKVGVADMAFLPYPAFGDNYRFLLSLIDGGGTDLRETQENGVDVEVLDDADTKIEKPRAYTTGRFVMWKRMKIKMVVLANLNQPADIAWNDVKAAYKRAFIDVQQPDAPGGFFNLPAQQWIAELKGAFTAAADQTALDAIAALPPADLATQYGRFFFPTHLTNNYNRNQLRSRLGNLARNMIKHACDNASPTLLFPGSTDGKKQGQEVLDRNSDGFFILLVRRLGDPAAPAASRRIGNLLGQSFGDRMFWFANRAIAPNSNVLLTTDTLNHEMGHAQYLRHGHTQGSIAGFGGGGDQANFFPAPPASGPAPASVAIRLFDSRKNNQILDHDQQDAFECIMSYTADTPNKPQFCGLCALTLRFFDRVAIQSDTEYQDEIMNPHDPALIVRASIAGGVWTLREPPTTGGTPTLPDLRVGRSMRLLCVGKEFPNPSNAARKFRANLSCADDSPRNLWSKSGAGDVRIATVNHDSVPTHIRITGVTAGTVTLSFAKSGVTASANIEIRP